LHIAFFAWFCNLAMHVGLSDMALFRYARHWSYGFYSAFGMYLGHFLSWICAGLMGATVAGLNPGQMAYTAAGLSGSIAVVLAGWTTANPTLYRAGLALQIATPNWSRWKITLVAGVATTILACFPVFFMKLLDFVAIYGLTLMPIGAIVFTEHWLFPRLGLQQYWAESKGALFNVPALITWALVLAICFPVEQFTNGYVRSPMHMLGVHLFFRWLPGWVIAVVVYPLLCCLASSAKAMERLGMGDEGQGTRDGGIQNLEHGAPRDTKSKIQNGLAPGMTFWLSGAIALAALVACVLLPLRVFLAGSAPAVYETHMASYKQWLLLASLVYFASATIWYGQREKARSK
jgi:NCS1 family nucleobase:cation symporter-1